MDTNEVLSRTRCEEVDTVGKYRLIYRAIQERVNGKWIDKHVKVWTEKDNSPSIDMGLMSWLYADKFFAPDIAQAIQATDFSSWHASITALLKGEKPKEISLFKGSSLTETKKR